MQRQRHSSANRTRHGSTSATSSASSAHPQKATIRPKKHFRHCSKRVVIVASLLILTIGLLLFGKSSSQYPPIPTSINTSPRAPSHAIQSTKPNLLSYTAHNFTLNGRPIRLLSGSVHYFRTTPSHWRRILQYARRMGLNAIETYIPWNLHEPVRGHFRFSGMLDLRAFLEIAHEIGLLVLLRPGPYICSEWDLGGLPPYLLRHDDMRLRSSHPEFLKEALRYIDTIAQVVSPYIGRPIVGLQIENEYGAFGKDSKYLEAIRAAWERHGFTRRNIMLFTSDNGGAETIQAGSPFDSAEVLKTINLAHNAERKLDMLRKLQPMAPGMIMELWTGWFDHWGENHHVRPGLDVVKEVRAAVIERDASVNLYMFFGGTNFGFMAGANMDQNVYLADVTSYDYDSFITEYGAVRASKFVPMQTMLRRFWKALGDTEMYQATLEDLPKAPAMSAYAGPIPLLQSIPFYTVLDLISDRTVLRETPVSMEEAGGDYGFILYRHNMTSSSTERLFQLSGVHDFAYILADGKVIKTIDRNKEIDPHTRTAKIIRLPPHTMVLDILVENRGRINYGPYLHDRKGITGDILLDSKPVKGWEIRTISFPQHHPLLPDPLGRQTITRIAKQMHGRSDHAPLHTASSPPAFFRGEMTINPGALDAFGGELPGTHCRVFGRGVLWVNGFNIGRFHTGVSGPQRSLFVPGAVLKEGRNQFVVLHMNMYLPREPPIVQLFEQPDLGAVEN